jgi:hypothetical protein
MSEYLSIVSKAKERSTFISVMLKKLKNFLYVLFEGGIMKRIGAKR